MFITFEGIEGSGKTTQVRMLAEVLKERGQDVLVTREPGGTVIGDDIRKILLHRKNKNIVPLCEVLLYYAARVQHLAEVIIPNQKKIILCDRFEESTLAYQGAGRKIDDKILQGLSSVVLKGFKPDLTLIFDLPVVEGLRRARGRAHGLAQDWCEDRFEREELSFHEKVRAAFLAMAKRDRRRFKVLDATKDVQTLRQEVLAIVERNINADHRP